MGVVVVMCGIFGVPYGRPRVTSCVSARRGIPEAAVIFIVQRNEKVRYLDGNVNYITDLSIEIDWCIRSAWCSFQNYTLELYDRPPSSSKYEC